MDQFLAGEVGASPGVLVDEWFLVSLEWGTRVEDELDGTLRKPVGTHDVNIERSRRSATLTGQLPRCVLPRTRIEFQVNHREIGGRDNEADGATLARSRHGERPTTRSRHTADEPLTEQVRRREADLDGFEACTLDHEQCVRLERDTRRAMLDGGGEMPGSAHGDGTLATLQFEPVIC